MSQQRQHILFSYFKTLSVGPSGVLTRDLDPARQTGAYPIELAGRAVSRLAKERETENINIAKKIQER